MDEYQSRTYTSLLDAACQIFGIGDWESAAFPQTYLQEFPENFISVPLIQEVAH